MMMSDVYRDICVELDLLPVVMSTDAVEPLAVPVVALVVGRPMNVGTISRAAVYPDLLSRRVIKSVDPDVGSGDTMSLKTIPGANGDACHSEWREMVLDEVVMENFVLVPEVCPVGSMTSAAEPTFLPALSEVYSPVILARGILARIQRECLSCRWSRIQRECLHYQWSELKFRRFILGRSPWMRSV